MKQHRENRELTFAKQLLGTKHGSFVRETIIRVLWVQTRSLKEAVSQSLSPLGCYAVATNSPGIFLAENIGLLLAHPVPAVAQPCVLLPIVRLVEEPRSLPYEREEKRGWSKHWSLEFSFIGRSKSHGHTPLPGGGKVNPTTCLEGECQDAGEQPHRLAGPQQVAEPECHPGPASPIHTVSALSCGLRGGRRASLPGPGNSQTSAMKHGSTLVTVTPRSVTSLLPAILALSTLGPTHARAVHVGYAHAAVSSQAWQRLQVTSSPRSGNRGKPLWHARSLIIKMAV